jgi:site-specific DNA recombinase
VLTGERLLVGQTPEIIVQTWRALRKQRPDVRENEVRNALVGFDELWNELFPAEQARIVELLVNRIDLRTDALDIVLKIDGLASLSLELQSETDFKQAADLVSAPGWAQTRGPCPGRPQRGSTIRS